MCSHPARRAARVREVAVRELAAQQPVGADRARVADVDHGRVERVQAQPEPDQEHRSAASAQAGRRPVLAARGRARSPIQTRRAIR